MRVLHLLPMNKMSGAEKMALLICKNQQGIENLVVTGGEELARFFEKESITTFQMNFSLKNIVKASKMLKAIVREQKIDIIHAHDNTASMTAYITKSLYRMDVKIVSHIHNCYPWLSTNTIQKSVDQFVRPRYDYNIACGTLVSDFYQENTTYLHDEKCLTLSNAMDMQDIKVMSDEDKVAVKKQFDLPLDKKIIGFIGRFSEQKGLIPFIKELAQHKGKFENSHFLIVGSGEEEVLFKTILAELNLEPYFSLVGFQEDVYQFYPIIDTFFLPSLYEGLPMVLLEAMAYETTVVSMDVGSISEVIDHTQNGFLVEATNYEQFIEQLLEAQKTTKPLGYHAKQTIEQNFNIIHYNKQLKKVYQQLLA